MNILFITADQWRGECLSALGHADVKTPNLDRLASNGVLFSRQYAQTTPCGPLAPIMPPDIHVNRPNVRLLG